MKVYVVEYRDCRGENTLAGIFSSVEKAEKFISQKFDYGGNIDNTFWWWWVVWPEIIDTYYTDLPLNERLDIDKEMLFYDNNGKKIDEQPIDGYK